MNEYLLDLFLPIYYYENLEILCFINIVLSIACFIYFQWHPLKFGPLVFSGQKSINQRLLSDKLCVSLTNLIPLLFFVPFVITTEQSQGPFTFPYLFFIGIHLYRGTYYSYARSKHSSPWPLPTFLFTLIQRCVVAFIAAISATYGLVSYQSSIFNGILKIALFVLVYLQVKEDLSLTRLRFVGQKGYKPVTGGMYKYVGSPSLLYELIIWILWGILLEVNIGTIAIWFWLIPTVYERAVNRHRWMHRTFKGQISPYQTPIIPFININALFRILASSLEFM
ncbi:hypothetical protein TRFO_19767 [Tritrichomonas foetus]|uniref:3-oxo-5-alpha-steroid 4-dehydrogenase C-terminal domain-containing protein n=1 Tax=Tritrichomonas foetus TaxID=1144522 RepID=A0A1J4KII1_9EUKA|nr:hypothetical protein TRFO_19767 [Tritrichomonas foetus]|eukprot:OHT10866.1 hypothetical protein TRFO_19767 [Tritrichomonas foetus]